ncbi:MAG: glycoside hydrolase family 2 [Clostridia bacterium]|nr:glycoside hydrolase family 2 [Clostridia bacterium]
MLNAYPRPQLRRGSFINLNGTWDFAVTRGERPASFSDTIQIPYPPESPLSGANRRIQPDETMWYRRAFPNPPHAADERVLLHFGAVDQIAEVFLNGKKLGKHEGGYLPFSFDVTALLRDDNELIVKAIDALDHTYPWGKQKHKNGGMWYTPFSGIWQTVWMEAVPEQYVRELSIRSSLDAISVTVFPSGEYQGALLTIETPNGPIRIEMTEPQITVPIPEPILWTPETPYLYPFTLVYGKDAVHSYFALRTVSQGVVNGVPRLLLNGKPYFFHGLLDQGYWPDGLCLPPDDGGYERDILAAKAQGFNTLRKHIKVEPLPFYEACDRLGMLVLQDFVNNGSYRFIHDTVLPTIGWKRLSDRHTNRGRTAQRIFAQAATDTILHLSNAPCIAGWTIFNEGWGQFCADEIYHSLKAFDPTRFFDATSGWFRQKMSDVRSEHVYFKRFRFRQDKKPFLLSEFGGYVYTENAGKKYGYRFYSDRASYQSALLRLYREEILPAVPKGLCGAIYTQISDVEEEKNGIMTYDRSVIKTDAAAMKALAEDLMRAIRSN